MSENGRVLLESYRAIAESVHQGRSITPAAEWLIDNFHLVEEQVRDIKDHLQPGFYRELPKLADGPLRGYPRVYGVAWAFVAHTDSRFDPDQLQRFIGAYQRVQPLTIGELWAVAITLRSVMVENLRRLSVRIVGSQIARQQADRIGDGLLELNGRSPQEAEATLATLPDNPLLPALAVQLLQRLRFQDPDTTPTLRWLDEKLATRHTNADSVVALEHAKQAAGNVTVRNIITSMRLMSAFDWQTFFEQVSLVDQVLRGAAGFASMDFITRDRYRHAVEELAKGTRRSEMDIARAVLAKTERVRQAAAKRGEAVDARRFDPGYYLIAGGRAEFQRDVGFRMSLSQRLVLGLFAHTGAAFTGSIALITLGLLALPLYTSVQAGVEPYGLLLLALFGVFPASDIALALVNLLATKTIGPRHLPRLELADGVPPSLRTLVVIPTLLIDEDQIIQQIEQLEVHYLANPEGDVGFALLSDWVDADSQTRPEDARLLDIARTGISELNARHSTTADATRFFVFHRGRAWNPSEGKWMAWERKRGKLHELNRLLRGDTQTSFVSIDGEAPRTPHGVRYVITLDADTRLPIGAVRQLVGTLAHPLNRPRFEHESNCVVEGYGLLQPRITPSLSLRRDNSIFRRLFSGPCGIDPYASAISDVYQDLFGEGSYTGKGIYDIDAFETTLAGRMPENALLSHDLFEGIFARCGLVSDIEFIEDFPAHSEVAAARMHRWARGDWQLLPWIFWRKDQGVSAIGRWKMLDNLRRTLSAPGMLAVLLASWLIPQASQVVWIGFALTALAVPALLPFLQNILPRRAKITTRSYLRALANDFVLGCGHIAILLTLLAHHAWLMLDAILRTLARLFITRSKLLEWTTAAQSKASSSGSLKTFFWRFRGAEIIAFACGALVLLINPGAIIAAGPFVLLWAASPVVAWFISLPPKPDKTDPLSASEIILLRLTGRRIWRFFSTLVTVEDHALPPDNFQEDPEPVIAHRSSPTNFGLYLLSIVAARDFGWIGLRESVDRIEDTLISMQGLERFRGHFFNWYETREARPLDPKYISSVDSGNLAGHLLVLAQACGEMAERPMLLTSSAGLQDTALLLRESLDESHNDHPEATIAVNALHEALTGFEQLLEHRPATFAELASHWDTLQSDADAVLDLAHAIAKERGETETEEIYAWAKRLHADVQSRAGDLTELLPWVHVCKRVGGTTSEESRIDQILLKVFPLDVALYDVPNRCAAAIAQLTQLHNNTRLRNPVDTTTLIAALQRSAQAGSSLIERLDTLAKSARELFYAMDFTFLFDSSRKLFSIGYRVNDDTLDPSYYDLLASEARLTSFIAIAKGDAPPAHWFRLGRVLTPVDGSAALVSWSGSMFEYLMPSLVLFTPRGSLLEQTCYLIIRQQIHYASEHQVPWGISESACNLRDLAFTYQYSNFGVPGLGLKRGLGQDLVIAPYATVLAAMYDPKAAVKNLERLQEAGGRGCYGFYEALDYTPTRLPIDQKVAVVRAYMAHHQGISLLALANVLYGAVMCHRFHNEPVVQATELLLQERTPRDVAVAHPRAEQVEVSHVKGALQPVLQRFDSPHLAVPSTHLLSNGRYAVMITAAGAGYSAWLNLAVTRWRPDVTRDCWGSYLFLRDTGTNDIWSATYQPTGVEPDRYEAVFVEDRAVITRQDKTIATRLEIILSSEDDAEIRHLSLTNTGARAREIEVTSYAEIVLAPPAADIAHPAFSNLFIQTEYWPAINTLIATRRPRSANDEVLCAAHVIALKAVAIGAIEYETDRARFLGRGRTARNPVAVLSGQPLSNTVGAVLDPIVSLRVRLRIAPGATARVAFSTIAATSREQIVDLADKYHDPATFDRISTLAWTQAQVQLHYLSIEPEEAYLFQRLANRILYSDPSLRPSSEVQQRNTLPVSGLWPHSISGDLPIILVRIDDADDRGIVQQLVRAHEYWGMKRLAVDLVVLNEKASSYAQDLQAFLEGIVRAGRATSEHYAHEPHGAIYVLRADHIPRQERDLLHTAARAILLSRQGSLSEQVMRMRSLAAESPSPARGPARASSDNLLPLPTLEFFNGLGGFAEDGREYVTVLDQDRCTPAPWINVIANPHFGFQVSESGAGYTWSVNSRENQLTPWSNDPVSDPTGEAFYIRDEDTGELWSPTALPIRVQDSRYIARHGQGYSRFEHLWNGVGSELLQFASWEDAIKISHLVLHNRSSRTRRLSLTAYIEWVLGFSRATSAPYIVTEVDEETGALFSSNPLNTEFGTRVAFADFGGRQTAWSAARTEFIGRNGSLEQPAALTTLGMPLSGTVGAGLDPCGVLQTNIELEPGERVERVFFLGQAQDRAAARELIRCHREKDANAAFAEVRDHWEAILGKVQVQTPDRAMDLLLNRWLLYQTLVCRFWARAAFYQAGGAYGFRDQLQDAMALVVAQPELARAHILRAAARQFVEGDVQHWWHPPAGRGVRTHFSDDLVWLPHVVSHYVRVTGDSSVLDAYVPFLEGQTLTPEQEDAYFEPQTSEHHATLFEHCARALERSLKVGAHGLPLIGSGDWNDGMNRIGQQGRGESVWLAWFLHGTLSKFAKLATSRGETAYAQRWLQHAAALKSALEKKAWDGAWYRRAYFDDGTPVGSASSEECRIDSIAQSWAVLSGAADTARARQAMDSVEEHLIRRRDGLALLFTPPFDKTPLDPGYIKGYLPGVRENGGQYTHAAVWCVMAYAALGDSAKAHELFAMLNPINHTDTEIKTDTYKVEPYVIAADVYALAPHVGRGGWTWYTGSAGWMYRAGIESILGLRVRGDSLTLDPCIRPDWRGFKICYRHGAARYEISVENPGGVARDVASIELDGLRLHSENQAVPLIDDGKVHHVKVTLS
ncbi:MAG: GH36-type glycosyl hydrolase domain-containing protein [Gammaproteobacteria bacterium]